VFYFACADGLLMTNTNAIYSRRQIDDISGLNLSHYE